MSKKVKIVLLTKEYDVYDEYSTAIIRAGISDWDEVSDEDYEFLRDNISRLDLAPKVGASQLVLVTQDDENITTRIDSIRKLVAKERAAQENARKRDIERQEQRAAAARERKLKKIAVSEASEKELLATLLQKYGSE